MEILNLNLVNFRNFSSRKFVFDSKLTLITGGNGVGKSNVLEAIGLLSAIKSDKAETDLDLVKFGKSDAKIEGAAKQNSSAEAAKLTINFQVVDERLVRKAYFIDEIRKRLVDFTNHLSIIIFAPSDMDLVTGSPSVRRHHLDTVLSGLDRDYWRALSAYNKVVVRRNKVLQRLQEGNSKPAELDFWDSRLIEHGREIAVKRKEFFEFLNFVEPTYAKATEGRPTFLQGLSWELDASAISEEKLEKNRQRDIAAGFTLSGPHRDDFDFKFKGKDLEYFGSRGEQRMAVLALKLAELEYFSIKRMTRPVLALDDIFSELDSDHRRAVLSVVGKQQTIITTAEPEALPKQIFKMAKVVELV